MKLIYRQLRARRMLLQIKDVPLRTRRALLLYKVYGNSALLVLNGTSLICNNTLLALNWRYASITLSPMRNIEGFFVFWRPLYTSCGGGVVFGSECQKVCIVYNSSTPYILSWCETTAFCHTSTDHHLETNSQPFCMNQFRNRSLLKRQMEF